MAKAATSYITEGFHTITPHLVLKDAKKAIEFYQNAFGAELLYAMPGPGGQGVMHAEIIIAGSRLMLGDEMPQMEFWVSPEKLNGTTVAIALYVPDADTVFEKAIIAGATVMMPLMDMFWGDRYGKIRDPFGHVWEIATHKQDLTPQEIQKGAEAFFASMDPGKSSS